MSDSAAEKMAEGRTWSIATIGPGQHMAARLITYSNATEDVLNRWAQGITNNVEFQLAFDAGVPGESRVAIYEHPEPHRYTPAVVKGEPPTVWNGHALAAFTSLEPEEIVGFMIAAWVAAWEPRFKAVLTLKNLQIAQLH